MVKKKAKKSVVKSKKPTKKTASKRNPTMVCGKCVFYVPNKDVEKIGACFQISGQVKENQEAKCNGKFFKQKITTHSDESAN